jgi:hypothetical protein
MTRIHAWARTRTTWGWSLPRARAWVYTWAAQGLAVVGECGDRQPEAFVAGPSECTVRCFRIPWSPGWRRRGRRWTRGCRRLAGVAWSHHGRVRNEAAIAALAALAGLSPVPASSGRTIRHRLNRGGDRNLNAAIHTIAESRQRYHQPTQDYTARRTAEGPTPREITRILNAT